MRYLGHKLWNMKIVKTEIYLYKIPMVPFTIATGTMEFAQNVLIKIHTDEGIIGWGECSAFPMIVGETQQSCYLLAKDFAAFWKGKDPLAMEDRLKELDQIIAGNYTAKSAFDLALYDIAAKAANQPLYAYLGGKQKPIESDLTIGIGTPDSMAKQAIEFKAKSVSMIKVKLGKKPAEDIERIQQIRSAIGKDIIVRIDDFGGKIGVTIREFVKSERYTGFTKAGTRISVDNFKAFKDIINSIDESELAAMQPSAEAVENSNLLRQFRRQDGSRSTVERLALAQRHRAPCRGDGGGSFRGYELHRTRVLQRNGDCS